MQKYVERRLLIGKAIYIYWPHAWPGQLGLSGADVWFNKIDIPFWPNFSRMKSCEVFSTCDICPVTEDQSCRYWKFAVW